MDVAWLVAILESFWDSIYPEFVLAVSGALVIVWQIRKQFTHALAQSRHNELLKLRLQLYQRIVPIAHGAQDAILDLTFYIRKFSSDISLFRRMSQTGRSGAIPSARIPEFLEKNALVERRAIDVVFFTERWEIVDSRIDLFRTAVNVALHEIREAHTNFFSLTLTMMPIETPPGNTNQGSLLPWQPPDKAGTDRLDRLTKSLNEALMDLSNWLHDLQVELQNIFLGELFDTKVPSRQPLDPKYIVVRLDRYDDLNRYFQEETNWGRYKLRIENEVRDRIAERAQAPTAEDTTA